MPGCSSTTPGSSRANVGPRGQAGGRWRELRHARRAHRVHGALDPVGDGGELRVTRAQLGGRRRASSRDAVSVGRLVGSSTRAAAAHRTSRGSSPTLGDHLREVHARGVRSGVVISPIGFVSDHLEVLFDLNVEARGGSATSWGCTWRAPARPARIPRLVARSRRPDRRAADAGARSARARGASGRATTCARRTAACRATATHKPWDAD